jgi:hypothetical protein
VFTDGESDCVARLELAPSGLAIRRHRSGVHRLGRADPRVTLSNHASAPAPVDRMAVDIPGERVAGENGKGHRDQKVSAPFPRQMLGGFGPLTTTDILNSDFRVGLPGFEPGTSASRTEPGRILSVSVLRRIAENVLVTCQISESPPDR